MGQQKTPHLTAGFKVSFDDEFYRARRPEIPGRGPFFETSFAHEFVIICKSWNVAAELSTAAHSCTVSDDVPKRVRVCQDAKKKSRAQKSPA